VAKFLLHEDSHWPSITCVEPQSVQHSPLIVRLVQKGMTLSDAVQVEFYNRFHTHRARARARHGVGGISIFL